MSEVTDALADGINQNREEVIDSFLEILGYDEIDTEVFSTLKDLLISYDQKQYSWLKNLNAQVIVEALGRVKSAE